MIWDIALLVACALLPLGLAYLARFLGQSETLITLGIMAIPFVIWAFVFWRGPIW